MTTSTASDATTGASSASGAASSAGAAGPATVAGTVDVRLTGTVYLDMVFGGLAGSPTPGHEVRAESLGISPGGIANLAVALRRLGLAIRLDAAFASDMHADYLWRTLHEEGVDLSESVRVADWSTPLTVALVYDDDRFMITHESTPPPAPQTDADHDRAPLPRARAAFATLGASGPAWLESVASTGARIFTDVGFDGSQRWADADLSGLRYAEAFMPNRVEAMAYTRTRTPEAAAGLLKERVPVAVVKCGHDGAIAWRAGDAAPIHEPAIDVKAIDTTGAGDVFDAAFIFGTLAGWALQDVLRFGNLCAGLSVRHYGGSLAAPSWGEIAGWVSTEPDGQRRYAFLQSYVGSVGECAAPQRAHATL